MATELEIAQRVVKANKITVRTLKIYIGDPNWTNGVNKAPRGYIPDHLRHAKDIINNCEAVIAIYEQRIVELEAASKEEAV